MTFKRLRYNLLVFGLIALVIAYLGMTIFLSQPSTTSENQADSSQSDSENNPGLVPDLPEDPDMDEEPDPGVSIPSGKLPLVIYALDILNNGAGYTSTYSSTLTNEATAGISVQQHIDGTISRGVNSAGESVAIQELFYHAENVPAVAAGQVANDFRGFYTNFDKGTTQIGVTTNYNLQNQTFNLEGQTNKTVSIAQAEDEFKIIESHGYPINITQKTAILSYDKEDPANKNFRRIRIKILSMENLSKNFKDNYGSDGRMKNIQFESVEIEFRINAKNGYISSMTRYESFKSQALGFSVKSTVTITQKFSSMNKAVLLRDSL